MNHPLILALFLTGCFALSCKTTSINAWKESSKCCEVYGIVDMEYGSDGIYPGVLNDSISTIRLRIAQIQKSPKIDGTDYCMLYAITQTHDTIASTAINGMPIFGQPRTYQVYGDKVWKTKPNLLELQFSLEPYCNRLSYVIIE